MRLPKLNPAELSKKIAIVALGGVLNAIGMNLFLTPANIYASGFAGLSQLLSHVIEDYTPFFVSTGTLYILFNIPVIILAWRMVGKDFTIFSFISVAFMTLFLELVPIYRMSHDIILNAVFGAVVSAFGTGLTLKWGASTGGMDIVVLILSRIKGKPLGTYFFVFNSLIILAAGILYGGEKALYTLVALYVSSRVIDAIHTRHVKITAFIVTKKGPEVRKAIHQCLVRGITTLSAKGGFTDEVKDVLMIVITRYELYQLKRVLTEVDSSAFVNVLHTEEVMGLFRKD
ncbi:YitT family protein [Ectobacillus ponti]|uniref:YitT family protein n=1 Tax=Ectobacillus ponti TaxID=2961894 RepID=A0AA41X3I6_9BACI|nr:YitT family protein [Ectobacillus ponti]MCP8968279.1 YitT family protein [Ectobacillus ponti]